MEFDNYQSQSQRITDDLNLFRSTVRRFIEKEFVQHQARWRQQHYPDVEAWTRAGEIGILLCNVPEEYGGGGATFAHEAVVLEELAYAGVPFGVREQSIVSRYILCYGTEQQKKDWLPRMARGELIGAIAMTEPCAGSDLQAIRATAYRNGCNYVINGSKIFITNGFHAGIICLAVKTNPTAVGPKAISLIIIETKDLAGYHCGQPLEKVGLHEQDTCEMFFEDVHVPITNLLGAAEGKGLFQMMEQLPYERLQIGIAALSMAEQALIITSKYVRGRIAFGNPLIELQNTRFRLAESKTDVCIGRVFIDDCIQRFMGGKLDPVTAAMAKYWLSECQNRVIDACVQLHGGYGYMMEYPIARMWVNARMQRIGGGTNEIMKEMIGWSI